MKRIALAATIVLVAGLIATAGSAEELGRKIVATQVVDLTQPMHDEMPFWPGGVPFHKQRLVDYDQGYQLHKFSMGENTGTHVDAPSHFVAGKHTIDQLSPSELVVPMVVVDVRARVAGNDDYQLTAADVLTWEAEHGPIPPRTLVVVNTGWHRRFSDPARYVNQDQNQVMHFPGYSASAAELLVKRDVAGIGIDTLSIDFGAAREFTVHLIMLRENKFQIENLTNLDAVPPTGATAVVGVLPVVGGSQAQARIFALLP